MVAPFKAAPALTFKRRNWFYVPAGGFANYKAPTLLEAGAASVVDFTRMAFREGTAQPSQTTNRTQSEPRLGDDRQFERKGITSLAGGTLQWAMDSQAVAASDGKKLWELFADGPDGGYLMRRLNIARDTALAVGQFVTIYPADIAQSLEIEVGDGESGEVGGTCDYFIRDEIAQVVALT